MHLLNRWTLQHKTLQVHRSHVSEVLDNITCDIDTKIKGQIMYFLVYASSLKPLNVATSKCAGA